VPQSGETRKQSKGDDAYSQAYKAARMEAVKGQLTASKMVTVREGVMEIWPDGSNYAALTTDAGRYITRGHRTERQSEDPQSVPPRTSPPDNTSTSSSVLTPAQLLQQLIDAGEAPSCSLICQAELTRFNPLEHQVLLPLLWRYILAHRNSNRRDVLAAVGAAIRKYIAIMPMDRMGALAVLLESGSRSPLPIELEIEVAKMIFRNFEVYPPADADPQPELAQRLLDIVQVYTHPRILLRDKHSAAASLAIEAIVSMRSPLAEQAWQAAVDCPYGWFAELVSDDLEDLYEQWGDKSPASAKWLRELRDEVLADV